MQHNMPPIVWLETQQPTRAELATEFRADIVDAAFTLCDRYLEHDERILEDVLKTLPDGAWLDGPEHRVKMPKSATRKIHLKMARGKTLEQATNSLNDAYRIFVVTEDDNELLPNAQQMVDDLLERGWKVTEAEHSFCDDNRYKGTAAIMTHPNGYKMEISFHTKATIAVKKATHDFYDIIRDPRFNKKSRDKLFDLEVGLSDVIATPPGLGPNDNPTLGGVPMVVKQYQRPSEEDLALLKGMMTGEFEIDADTRRILDSAEEIAEEFHRDGAHSLVQRMIAQHARNEYPRNGFER